MTWAFSLQIPGNIKIVLLALADNANDTGECWPRQEIIAAKASVSVRNLRRLLHELEDRELIAVVERRRADGYKASNLYQLLPDKMAAEISPDTGAHSHRPTVSDQEPPVEPPKRVNAREVDQRQEQRRQAAVDWDTFWQNYPRKVGKDAALRAWNAALKRTTSDTILVGLERLLPSLTAREPQFVPHPSTWLNAGSWADEVDPPSSTRQGPTPRQPIDPQREWEYR